MATIPEAMSIAVNHHQAGRLDDAKLIYEQVLQVVPDHPDALHLLGVIAHQNGNHQVAIEQIRRAIKSNPHAAAYYGNLGVAYRASGRVDEAVACYRRALEIAPEYAEAHNNLGNLLNRLDMPDEALACCQRALQIRPDYAEAHDNLGNALQAQGRLDEAVATYQRALQGNPGLAETHRNLGFAYMQQRKLDEAAACFRRAVQLSPDKAEVHNLLGLALKDLGRNREAEASFRQSLRIDPDQRLTEVRIATNCPIVFHTNQQIDQYRNKLLADLRRLSKKAFRIDLSDPGFVGCQPPWNLLYHGRDNRPIKEAHARVFHGCFPRYAPTVRAGRPRVGFVVTDGHEGIFLKFMRGILERMNPELFEVFVICSRKKADRFHALASSGSIRILPLSEQFDRILETMWAARFDLLYYWEVGSDALSYFLPFCRLARVQCTSMGIPDTSGIPEMDYYLSCEHGETEDADLHYTETLVRTKTTLAYLPRRQIPDAAKPREAFGFSADQHLYLCPQKIEKLHPDLDPILAAILRRDPLGAVVLVCVRPGRSVDTLRRRLAVTMPDVIDRIVMLPRQDFPDYLSLLAAADVLLDPLHYSGGTTTYDALSMGKPIVTLPSEFLAGRGTLGCYKIMGVMDCVASDPKQYVVIALRLATDTDYRATVVKRIRAASGLLFENLEAVRELERVFGELTERARAGQTPDNGGVKQRS